MMNTEIILALVLLAVHVWLVPMAFSLAHAKWLLGARDETVELSLLTFGLNVPLPTIWNPCRHFWPSRCC